MEPQWTPAGYSMLIVEDDAIARNSLRGTLERRYPALALHDAANGSEGLELFRELRPQIVMTDIWMPGMSGISMMQEIRLLAPQTQIIVITAHSETDLMQDCIRLGVNRYLPKPIDSRFMLEAVDDCLSRIELGSRLKAQHEELTESGERLRLALESAHLGTWDYHPDSGEILWDERCRHMFGMPDEIRTCYWAAIGRIHSDDRDRVGRALKQALAGADDGAFHQEFRVVWPDGSVHWIASHGMAYPDDRGACRLIGANMDISSREQANEELRESEARYRGLFNSLQEGFSLHEAIIDGSGVDYRFLEINPAFERLAGMSREDLVGKTISEVFPELEELWLSCLAQVATTRVPATLEHHAVASDRYFEVQVYSPARGQVAALYSDVSERRKLQMEREKNERLESLGVLAGGIAHDFNNILMAIAGNISLARMQMGQDNAVAEARLEDSEKAVAKAAALTRQLLTFARGGAPVKKPLGTEALIREAASLFLSGGNCKAELWLAQDLWCLQADAGQIHQALNNLILNAVQAMPKGGVVSISAANETIVSGDDGSLLPGRYLKIVIADQGEGIAPELLPRIFDPYFTTKSTGSGLGLASVFSIVKRHEGAIAASSAPGGGARFELLLPASDEGSEEEAAAAAHVPAAGSGAAVLLMDDEEMIRNLSALMLTKLGYRATVCSDGAEAVYLYRASVARGEPFAAVILDMTVPGGMGGKEAAELIRIVDSEAVLVISSGYSAETFLDEEREVRVNGMVAKPYNMGQLADELARVLSPA